MAGRGYRVYRIGNGTLYPFHKNGFQEVIYCDYLASKRTPKDIQTTTGFKIARMDTKTLVASILQQDRMSDLHKIYTYGAVAAAPLPVRWNTKVRAMRQKWRQLASESPVLSQELRDGCKPVT